MNLSKHPFSTSVNTLCSGFGLPILDFLANAPHNVVGLVMAKITRVLTRIDLFTHFLLRGGIRRRAKQA